jgi:DNA-binding transcriptional MerR regulator/effector-binding domain-containing protein
MFTIGDFAKLGRVSVRMLRHYDAIGLLRPAAVDPASGYRFYNADQLRRLNRVIALKDLGFTLQQVQAILDDKVDAAEIRGMLRLRRAQLEAQITADATRLTGVEARLRMIEKEGHMGTEDVVLKEVAPIRVAALSAVAASYGPEDIGPTLTPLYPELFRRLDAAGLTVAGPPIAYYEPAPGESGEAVVVHAAAPVTAGPHPDYDFAVVDLPAIRSAATIIHHGPMDDVEQSMQVLARWIEDNGYRPAGYAREVYLDYYPDEADKGVTELQITVARD